MRVKYLAQEHNAVPRPGLETGPFNPESSALTIRPPRLPHAICNNVHKYHESDFKLNLVILDLLGRKTEDKLCGCNEKPAKFASYLPFHIKKERLHL